MKVGDRVRVKESIIVYHHPEHRNQSFDIKGLEGGGGVCQRMARQTYKHNLPVYVQFSKNSRLTCVKLN